MRLNRRHRDIGKRTAAPFRVPHVRRAFTLIELLVVIAIMVTLAGITLAFLPKREVRLASQGADQLQTYLASARSRALRDQAPRGVRLLPTGGPFREFEMIEVPEPYAPVPPFPPLTSPLLAIVQAGSTTVHFPSASFTLAAGNIQAGDMLEITDGVGSIHRVTSVHYTSNRCTLASSPPGAAISPAKTAHVKGTKPTSAALALSNNFRFIRQARPLMGEPTLQLPNTVYVMPNATSGAEGSLNIPTSYTGANTDIVFAPSGQVIGAAGGRIVLWLTDDNGVSAPTLLTIYTRTGAVAAHPIGPSSNYYQFTQDGRSSGQ